MKRTIEEVMDLLEQKRENAKAEIDRAYQEKTLIKNGQPNIDTYEISRLGGEYDAYTDVICLIASSHLLEKGE